MEHDGGGWAPYVPVAERRAKAARMLAKLRKKGRICEPVTIEGRTIARSFWGKKWCLNLESYSDYDNRLPRGRTYVRNGSVVDLQIRAGEISALVAGSEIYQTQITVHPLPAPHWRAILAECAGKVASLVELLQGRLSDAVMDLVTRHDTGLFPAPEQIDFRCNCPDYSSMCKHVAATLYAVGARLDQQPELLFLLRGVDPRELIDQAASMSITQLQPTADALQQMDDAGLTALFGIDFGEPPAFGETDPTAATLPPIKNTAPKRQARQNDTVTAAALIARGIPRHMVQNWLRCGVLSRTNERGSYRSTAQTEARILAYLQRR